MVDGALVRLAPLPELAGAQLDRKTQEVEIEARVVAATRSFARDIGTQLGFGFGNGSTGVGGASAVGTSPLSVFNTPGAAYPIIGTSAPKPGTGVQIPLFSNLGAVGPTSGLSFVNASNAVRLDAVLTMAESRGLLKILSRPRVVTQNNIQAIVKQGVRIPIVTAAQYRLVPARSISPTTRCSSCVAAILESSSISGPGTVTAPRL